jgi:putative FmdB family regulatory protein
VPLYEYQCDRDGRFEVIRKFSDPPLKKCPKCGGPIQRLPSAPAIQFKGTGWYVTDYAKKSGGEGSKGKDASASSDSSAGSSKGKSEGGKSDGGKSEGGKSEGGKSEGGKSEGSKGESSKNESSKNETPAKAAGSYGKKGS